MIELTELEHDTISELINIGVGRAASSLSEMVAQPVELTVPTISFVERFSNSELAPKIHTDVIQNLLGEQLIGHVSRDSTATTSSIKGIGA